MKKFVGTGVALVTPFKEDRSVDVEALKKIVRFQKENGVNYLVVLGTTGEYATLTQQEKEVVKKTVIEENNGALPLVIGIGGNNTQAVTDQVKKENLEGFDAILSVSPYYVKPTQEGIYQHFKKVSQASNLPVILYNVPGRTGSNMTPKTVARLATDFENIIGIKEAAGDMMQAMQMIRQTPKDFLVISGEDMLTLPIVLAGGSGVISVIAGGFPKNFAEMVQKGLGRDVDEAYQIHYKITPAIELVFEEGNPAGIKAVFNKLGIAKDYVRLPLVEASKELTAKIVSFVDEIK
ncbi:4-hydroxy-tetrahydrodipicolinate synthase [Mesonia aestuariivivens]|uniref:4-hydroxy-tetrahydrodipicolinate synthase n=1 Tax=Mesonia aestuariivivens TaxID=2796128 RepID=A0ABS6W041_9FLAO|nr:4-hydroxy-tetrahydrodipicolinate synthase [Mesonia aestuariivivens]MBW2961192.1 4-hydroxy-tetrahydrodipicolinate synthase [Mesonia aestuariivivens]